MNTNAPIEPTVDQAFITLKNAVYSRGLNVTINDAMTGQSIVYHAVLFDEDILRPDTTATTSKSNLHTNNDYKGVQYLFNTSILAVYKNKTNVQ